MKITLHFHRRLQSELGNKADTNVNFAVEILVEQRDQHLYAATMMPFGVTGYADTHDGAIERAK